MPGQARVFSPEVNGSWPRPGVTAGVRDRDARRAAMRPWTRPAAREILDRSA